MIATSVAQSQQEGETEFGLWLLPDRFTGYLCSLLCYHFVMGAARPEAGMVYTHEPTEGASFHPLRWGPNAFEAIEHLVFSRATVRVFCCPLCFQENMSWITSYLNCPMGNTPARSANGAGAPSRARPAWVSPATSTDAGRNTCIRPRNCAACISRHLTSRMATTRSSKLPTAASSTTSGRPRHAACQLSGNARPSRRCVLPLSRGTPAGAAAILMPVMAAPAPG